MRKRISAILLSLIIVFSMVPQAASAAGTGPTAAPKDPDSRTVLAFTSDVHNKVTNESAERLDNWINNVENIHGKIDVFSFCGDMADSGDEELYWHNTQVSVTVVNDHGIKGVYTTGNHEYDPGHFIAGSSDQLMQRFKINTEGAAGSNYRIYCLGSQSNNPEYTQPALWSLESYLESAGNDKPIFIVTHYPLHYYDDRYTNNAVDIIDAINEMAVRKGQTIVFIWGHNHSTGDPNYDTVFKPGDTIEYDKNGNTRTLRFYYCSAGCMSDIEYSYNNGSIAGKGLVITVDHANKISFTYYGADGSDVTKGGTYSLQDAVAVETVSICDPYGQRITSATDITKGSALQLYRGVSPSDAAVETVSWESSDPAIATVTASGRVKGISEGTAVITVKVTDSAADAVHTASIKVTVSRRTGSTYYVLSDSLKDGKNYLIAGSKAEGLSYALANEGSGFSGAPFGSAAVEIASRDIDGDGESELYIDTDEDSIIWTAVANGDGFDLVNGEGVLEGVFENVRVFQPQRNQNRYWTYQDSILEHKGGPNVYNLYYDDGFKYVRYSADTVYDKSEIYIYEQADISVPTGMWIMPEGEDGDSSRLYVSVSDIRKTGASYFGTATTCTYTGTLYLPFGVDPSVCRFFWDGGMSVTYSGSSYVSGSCPLPPEMCVPATYTFKDGDDTLIYDITVCQGSMFVEPSEANGIPSRIGVSVSDRSKTVSGSDAETKTKYTYTCQLYMPGGADLADCRLSWAGDIEAVSSGSVFRSGACPVPDSGMNAVYSFTDGNTTWEFIITTYQGSPQPNVQQVFIEIDESKGTIARLKESKENTCSGRIFINGQEYELARIKGRGNATWTDYGYFKKPYNIKLDTKISFPGTGADKTKNWSFLAEGADPSLLCNRSGLYLARQLGIGYGTASADVWMNGEYQGCYTVTPKTDSYVNKNGYMIEEDNYLEPTVENGGDPQFSLAGLYETSGWSSAFNRITVKKMGDNFLGKNEAGEVDESPENLSAKADTIRRWLQSAWDAIRSNGGRPGYNTAGEHYTDYIDIESFAKMYLIQEFVKNYDICAGSLLFHRDGTGKDDKLIAGPLWDLDNALGSTYRNPGLGAADDRENGDRRSAEGDFIVNVNEKGYKTSVYKTIGRLDDFMEEVYRQYNLHRGEFQSLADKVESMVSGDSAIMASAMMNHKKNDFTGDNNHKYESRTILGSGRYTQTYMSAMDPETDWPYYAENLITYVTVRCRWFSDNYTRPLIIFDTDGGSEVKAIVGAAGTAIDPDELPEDPQKEGYIFAGWDRPIPDTMPEEDLVIRALWARSHTVTFVNEDGTVLQKTSVAEGEVPVYSGETPVKAGSPYYSYTFTGWDKELIPVTEDAVYTAMFSTDVTLYATAVSAQLVLKDNIYILLNFNIPEEASKGWTAKMYYEKDNTETEEFVNVRKTDDLTSYAGKSCRLTFEGIAAKELTERVRVVIEDADGNIVPIAVNKSSGTVFNEYFDYSAADYANAAAKLTDSRYAKLSTLGKALLNYGGSAQVYWNYKTEKNANAAGYLEDEMAAVTVADLEPHKAVDLSGDKDAVGYTGMALTLKDFTEVVLYCNNEAAMTKDGIAIEVSRSGSSWLGRIKGIAAKNLRDRFTIAISYDGNTFTQELSPLSWSYAALSSDKTSDEAKNLAKAIYLYQDAAYEYFINK